MKIALLSNINLESLSRKLSKTYEIYLLAGFNTWIQSLSNPSSSLYSFKPQIVFIILDGEEIIKQDFEQYQMILEEYFSYIEHAAQNNPSTVYFISNFDIPQKILKSLEDKRLERRIETYWTQLLEEKKKDYHNLFIFDLKNLITEIGREQFYSSKLWYLGSMKYTMRAEEVLQKAIKRYCNAFVGKRKKCLVLDLDNTLWGGVIGEDGLDGIILSDFKEGARFKDFQRRVKEFVDHGVILCVVSKNNYNDAMEVFKNHKDMILKTDDFVSMKINWNLKSENIKELSEELNIGLDSFVFIDDNPRERGAVKQALPDVCVPEFPEDTTKLEKFIIEIYKDYFLPLKLTNEDKKKSTLYKQNFDREKAKKTSASFEDFLFSLETRINLTHARLEDVDRIAQLTQKTNQFNITTKRYTKQDILEFIKSKEHEVFIGNVIDRYGDNGKVIVVILKKDKEESKIVIDTFLMSCRVMGRFIEDSVFDFIENYALKFDFKELVSNYNKTSKNQPVVNFFDRMGYETIKEDEKGNKVYTYDLRKKINRKLYYEVNK